MSAINTNDSKAPVKKVKTVQFGILSPEEIRRMSVTEGGVRWALAFTLLQQFHQVIWDLVSVSERSNRKMECFLWNGNRLAWCYTSHKHVHPLWWNYWHSLFSMQLLQYLRRNHGNFWSFVHQVPRSLRGRPTQAWRSDGPKAGRSRPPIQVPTQN